MTAARPPSGAQIFLVCAELGGLVGAGSLHPLATAQQWDLYLVDDGSPRAFMTQAHLGAAQAGLDTLDALHIAAAKLGGTEEFVTTARLTTALFRVVGLKMTTIRPTRL